MEFLEIFCIVTALILVVKAIGSGIKELGHGIASTPDNLEELKVENPYSPKKHSRVACLCRDKNTNAYVAKIVCRQLNKEQWVTANSREEMEQKIRETHTRYDEMFAPWDVD